MPSSEFPELILSSLSSLLFMITNAQSALITKSFIQQIDKLKSFHNIQKLLIAHMFSDNAEIKEKSILLLVNAWKHLPPDAVDPNPTGLMYSIIYAITWIFSSIELQKIEGSSVQY